LDSQVGYRGYKLGSGRREVENKTESLNYSFLKHILLLLPFYGKGLAGNKNNLSKNNMNNTIATI
jgi:hypothetical protein